MLAIAGGLRKLLRNCLEYRGICMDHIVDCLNSITPKPDKIDVLEKGVVGIWYDSKFHASNMSRTLLRKITDAKSVSVCIQDVRSNGTVVEVDV